MLYFDLSVPALTFPFSEDRSNIIGFCGQYAACKPWGYFMLFGSVSLSWKQHMNNNL